MWFRTSPLFGNCGTTIGLLMDHPSEEEMERQRLQQWLDASVGCWQRYSDVLDCGRNLHLWHASEKPDNRWRQLVLFDTLDMLKTPDARESKRAEAMANVEAWRAQVEERAAAAGTAFKTTALHSTRSCL